MKAVIDIILIIIIALLRQPILGRAGNERVSWRRVVAPPVPEAYQDIFLVRWLPRVLLTAFVIIAIGLALLLQNYSDVCALFGLVIVGLGCAPIYPSMIHSTPSRFGEDNSQSVIGVRMASAYVGNTLMPPFFGILVKFFDVSLFPFYMIVILILMILGHHGLVKKTKQ